MGKVRTSDPNEALGVSLVHPDILIPKYDTQTSDGKYYGFTLWKQEHRSAQHCERGTAVARVALAYDLRPEEIEATVQEKLEAYSDLSMTRKEVTVAEKGYRGVAVEPIPGSTPSTEIYVPVNSLVYQIKIYNEELDTEGKELLASLKFNPVSRPVDSLDLPDASNAATFYPDAEDQEHVEREGSARAEAQSMQTPEETLKAAGLSHFPESQIGEGCWRAASSFFFQTQHGMHANRSSDGIPTGYTIVGHPNYWDEYTHGALGYGRCAKPNFTNDKFAVDYPLDRGDAVFSPFKKARVTWAGKHWDHANYGIFVVTQAYDSAGTSLHRYWNLSAHLSALKKGIRPGAIVTDKDLIGYAGATGDPSIPVGPSHLHSAFYRNPHTIGGRPYGGQGLQVIYHHYVGTAAGNRPGIYTFGWKANSTTKAKGSLISN